MTEVRAVECKPGSKQSQVDDDIMINNSNKTAGGQTSVKLGMDALNNEQLDTNEMGQKKISTFQITSVRVLHTSGEHGEDSQDDLDETSHLDDLSSEILDSSIKTDDQNVWDASSVGTAGSGASDRGIEISVSNTTSSTHTISNAQNGSHSRFKVVKVETKDPFRRGRWTCKDYLGHDGPSPDQPQHVPAENLQVADSHSEAQPSDLGPLMDSTGSIPDIPPAPTPAIADQQAGMSNVQSTPGNMHNPGAQSQVNSEQIPPAKDAVLAQPGRPDQISTKPAERGSRVPSLNDTTSSTGDTEIDLTNIHTAQQLENMLPIVTSGINDENGDDG